MQFAGGSFPRKIFLANSEEVMRNSVPYMFPAPKIRKQPMACRIAFQKTPFVTKETNPEKFLLMLASHYGLSIKQIALAGITLDKHRNRVHDSFHDVDRKRRQVKRPGDNHGQSASGVKSQNQGAG
jgi:hypothetical protein